MNARLQSLLDTAAARVAPLMDRYAELQARERLFVGVGAVFVALSIVYGLIWLPAASARKSQTVALEAERALAQRLEAIAATVQKARASGQAGIQGQGQSLLTLVDQQGRAPELGKAPARLQPEGENEVRVWFEDVPFDKLVLWMSQLETRYGTRISAAEFERRAGPGLVNARLTVTRP